MKLATKLLSVPMAMTLISSMGGIEPANAARRQPGVSAQRQRANAAAKAARVRKARQDRVTKHLKARPQREAEQRKASVLAHDGFRALRGNAAARRSGRASGAARVRRLGPTTTVTMTPTTNLAPAQLVHITGSGLTAGSYFFVVECANDGGQGVIDCDLSNYRPVITGTGGTVDMQFMANRHIRLSDGSVYDCGQAPNVCNISWVDLGNPVETAAVPISFDPNAAPPISLSVSPSTNLVHLQTVNFSGTAPPDSMVDVMQCPTGSDPAACYNTARGYAYVDVNGKFADTMNVRRIIGRTGSTVDCATPNACELIASEYGSLDLIARAPLNFNPNGPVPPPVVLTATPNAGLLHGQDVSVTGSGFDPFDFVFLSQCSVDAQGQLDACRSDSNFVPADGVGAFTTTLAVTRRLWSYSGAFVDCAQVQCLLTASTGNGNAIVANIGFDGTVPPPALPSVTVAPSTGLSHAQTVTVTGANFDPNADVDIEQCADTTYACRRTSGYFTAGADGSFSQQVAVSRTLTNYFGGGVIDCADASMGCVLTVSDLSSGFSVSSTILFAPGPLPAPATAKFMTTKALHDGRAVRIVGEGWFPGDDVSIQQCAVDAQGNTRGCIYTDESAYLVSSEGKLSIPFTPHRKVTAFQCEGNCDLAAVKAAANSARTVDCIDEGITCVVSVYDYADQTNLQIPMRFDRGAPLAPPPTLEASPRTKLRDRQTINVTGKGFDAGSQIELGVCQVDNREYCSSFASATADEKGALSTSMVVRRFIGTGANGSRKCDVDGVHCAVVVLYTSSYLQSLVSVPIAFDRGSPIQQGTIIVTPTDGLVDGQTVQIVGRNWSPNSQVIFAQCAAFDGPTAGCGNIGFATTDESGSFDTTLNVASLLVGQSGSRVDCTASPGACVVAVGEQSGYELAFVPLTFGMVVTPTTRPTA